MKRNIYFLAALQVVNEMAFIYYADNEDDCTLESAQTLAETIFYNMCDDDVECDVAADLVNIFGEKYGKPMYEVMNVLATAVKLKSATTIENTAQDVNDGLVFNVAYVPSSAEGELALITLRVKMEGCELHRHGEGYLLKTWGGLETYCKDLDEVKHEMKFWEDSLVPNED